MKKFKNVFSKIVHNSVVQLVFICFIVVCLLSPNMPVSATSSNMSYGGIKSTDTIEIATNGFAGFTSKTDYFDSVSPMEPSNSYESEIGEFVPADDGKEEKLVYSSNIDLETKDIQKTIDDVHAKIKAVDGIIQNESMKNLNSIAREEDWYNRYNNAYGYIYVRIPQAKLNEFMDGLGSSEIYVVTDTSNSVENMTDIYYDNEARLKSLRTQESRLLYFMENATSIPDMLDIESRLADIQYKIDSITNSQLEIDNDVKYSKVQINIEEVVRYTEPTPNPQNFWERLKEYFDNSGDAFLENMEGLLAGVIYYGPYLVIVCVLFIILKHISKKRKSKKNTKIVQDSDENNEI